MIAIETNILMHAYREKFENDEQRKWHSIALALLKQLAHDEVTVCVSVISVSEYLVGVAESDRPRVGDTRNPQQKRLTSRVELLVDLL